MKPARCPFYPDSCTVEFHPNMQHVWIDKERLKVNLAQPPIRLDRKSVTNITNSERAQAWNKANRKQYNARQKTLMQARRGKRGG